MLRTFIGALVGFIALSMFSRGAATLISALFGCQFAYKEVGSFELTQTWAVLALTLGFVGCFLGGKITYRIGGWKACKVLALVIILIGMFFVASENKRDQGQLALEREGQNPCDLSLSDASRLSVVPAWYNILTPLVGAAAVWIAGGGVRRKKA